MTATQSWETTALPPARNRQATAGFTLGLVGLLVGWLPVLGLLVTVPALLLSRAARARYRQGRAATAGRSGAGLALGAVGTLICVGMTTLVIANGASAAPAAPAPVAEPLPVAAVPAAPVLLTVPNVVGMADAQARDVLRAAGFTTVVLGPSTGSVAGVAAGTVTTQLPGPAALASASDPITLGEAAQPPVATQAPAAPVVQEPVVQEPVAPRPVVAQPARQNVTAPAPAARQQTVEAPRPLAATPASAYYKNCDAARAAGAAPLHRGDAGYRSALDRDNDGVACE